MMERSTRGRAAVSSSSTKITSAQWVTTPIVRMLEAAAVGTPDPLRGPHKGVPRRRALPGWRVKER